MTKTHHYSHFWKPLEGSWLKNIERESSGVQLREERNEGRGPSHIYRGV